MKKRGTLIYSLSTPQTTPLAQPSCSPHGHHQLTPNWAFSHFPSSGHATAQTPCVSSTSSAVSLSHFSMATRNESLGCHSLPCLLDWILSIIYMDILGLVFDTERLYRKEIMFAPSALERPASPGAAFYPAGPHTPPRILKGCLPR